MTKTLMIFVGILMATAISSCGVMTQNCASIVDDRDAYRHCMAAQGDQVAQYEMGMAAFDGESYGDAINWFKRAARPRASQQPIYLQEPQRRRDLSFEQDIRPPLPGHRGAQRMLVRIYEEGIGVSPNPEEATRYREMINQ